VFVNTPLASLEINDSAWAGRAAVCPARYMRWSTAAACRSGLHSPQAKRTTTGREVLIPTKSGSMLLADRGYDADWIRTLVRQHRTWANIPPKSNRKEALSFSPYFYRARNLVERFFNKIKSVGVWQPATTKLWWFWAFAKLDMPGEFCRPIIPKFTRIYK
jgi:transposase